ncbi:E3 ubiquitin-protein ligase ari-2 isoform X2 [Lycorma delicatula]|uniref:E3 ubiquitin-protein ligase ari-2 isoform X2 n=1 Tax=Lycorma delicatula TaxID=130591 RepID=UPI003F515F16
MSVEECDDSEMDYSEDDCSYDDYYNIGEDCDVEQVDLNKSDPEYFAYECLSVEEVELLLNESVETLSNSLQITPSLAKVLLHTHEWQITSIITEYRRDVNRLLVSSRVKPPNPPDSLQRPGFGSTLSCPVCVAYFFWDKFSSLACGHPFCNNCWAMHFEVQITEGISTGIACMAQDCEVLAPEDFVLTLLTRPQLREKYQQFAFRDYVKSHPQLRFCPGLNCQVVLRSKEPKAKRATCSYCNSVFCFKCGGEYHAPTDCSTIKKWLTKCADDSETANYISAHTKDCPRCHICIEKNGGCNHMQCYNCKHDFCWMCLGDWKSHGSEYYECSRYKENPNIANESAHAQAREALKKYLHYYERWENHSKSLRLEEQTVEKIKSRINVKVMTASGTWIDWQYLMDAAALLAKCRYTLQYTYPYAYYMEPGPRKELFEYQQAQLEAEIENLSWKIERAETTDRGDLENQIDIAEKRRTTLLKDFLEMENSAYAPNPLPPPALVVFSQAGGLPEALRMQRPFNTQAQEGKELQVPFSATGFGLRLMDSYSGLPAHLLHHLQPQFHIHPALDPRSVPFSATSYQSLTATTDSNKTFPSAFAPPPTKCLKMEASNENQLNVNNNNHHPSGVFYQTRAGSTSPGSGSVSPPAKEEEQQSSSIEDSETTSTPTAEGTERLTPEEGRGFRRKKKFQSEPWCCPVCSVTVRMADLESHFVQELEKLYKLTGKGSTGRRPSGCPSPRDRDPADGSLEGRWETYQRIKANRQGRLRIKYRKRKPDEVTCPVCNEPVNGTVEELNNHVEMCLRKQGSGSNEDENENVDVEGEGDVEMYEEYEWAGQRRIRASTLLVGGYAGVGMASSSRPTREEEDAYLVVDGDDSATFGPSQYSEADVVLPSADGPNDDKESEPTSPENRSQDSRLQNIKEEPSDSSKENRDEVNNSQSQVLEALKSRIRDLEGETKVLSEEKFICLICMEHYKKPVISICCWHVHCEECWLHTLGAKKLCPQCNMITSPSDLRRIYL